MTALLTGLQKVNADVSDGGGKLRATLASLVLETPTGKVSLDKNRNAIADEFLTEVARILMASSITNLSRLFRR